MSENPESDQPLSIRCPSCRQRFNVDENLMGRTVECGGCEARFRIDDEVIIRPKKYYPGERGGPNLSRFQRVPLTSGEVPAGARPVQYAEFNHPEQLGPASPQRVIAGILGGVLMAGTALFLLLSKSQQEFGAMSVMGKLIIACFVSLLGLVLLIYANPRGRKKAIVFGLFMAAGVISIPLFVKAGPSLPVQGESAPVRQEEPKAETSEADAISQLRRRLGTKPLLEEQTRLRENGSEKKAYGIYLTGLVRRNIYTARDFLIRDTQAGPTSHPYPRDDGDYLVVLTGVSMDFGQVSEIASKLGKIESAHPEIDVVVIRVNNEQFLAGSAEKLNNKTDPAFYDLNKRELESIDLDRVRRAVERLADAEPTIYRSDISRMLVELMAKPGVNFHDSIARALKSWSEDPNAAAEAAVPVIQRYVNAGEMVPENVVDLAAIEGNDEAIPLIYEIWIENPILWDSYLLRFGEKVESLVLDKLESEDAPLQRSAAKILGQIGTGKTLPALKKLLDKDDPEIRVLAERAIKAIEDR
ncbi:HEAT repeat domain-containing protein [Luteolibacter algae]|uniref:HEAT repeat domain-containing protein n=1 Tax=Luteolibacter algae TaxID=454151 RepID=A0ABW5D4X9_9BACT